VAEAVQAYQRGATANTDTELAYQALKEKFGLRYAAYEAGPGGAVGGEKPGTVGLDHFIEANRQQGMKSAVETAINSFWKNGGDIYNYFAVEGPCSTYGCWGAVEDWRNVSGAAVPPKLAAIYDLTK